MSDPMLTGELERAEAAGLRFARLKWWCFCLLIAILASPLLFLVEPTWRIGQSILYGEIHGPELERLHGFRLATPVLKFEDGYREVPVIEAHPGGFMRAVGFGECDVILSHTRASFLKTLYKRRGQTVKVEVVNVDDLDEPVPRSDARTVEFTVPG